MYVQKGSDVRQRELNVRQWDLHVRQWGWIDVNGATYLSALAGSLASFER